MALATWLAGALAALAVTVFALPMLGGGCERRSGSGRGAKEITFWHIQTRGAAKEVIDAAVARFEAANPAVKAKVTAIQNDPFKRKLAVAMTAGSPPDVFFTWGGGVLASDARAGRVLDITGRVEGEHLGGLGPAALGFCRLDGKLYALPADVGAVVFWYNRDIFRENGLRPPATYAEFRDLCARLQGAAVTPLALGNADKWPGAFYFIYFAMRLGGLEPFADALAREPGPGFEHPSFIEAGRLTRELAESGCFTRGLNGVDYLRARGLFFQGRAAMILMGPWLLGEARREAPEGFIEKLDCFAFPTLEGGEGDPSLVLGGVNAGYAVASTCPHPDEAVALVKELTSLDTARAWSKTGRIPALRAELVKPMLPPESRGVAEVLGRAEAIQLYYDQALPPELGEVHKTTTQGLLGGTKTPEEAARLMEEETREMARRGAP